MAVWSAGVCLERVLLGGSSSGSFGKWGPIGFQLFGVWSVQTWAVGLDRWRPGQLGLVVAWSAWAGSLVTRSRGAIQWKPGHMGLKQQRLLSVSPWSGQPGQWNLISRGLVREVLISGDFCSLGLRGDLVSGDLSSVCLFSGAYPLGSWSKTSGHLRPG